MRRRTEVEDEKVMLTVRTSGVGCDGRNANVAVNVGDDGGSGWDVDDEAGALRLLQGLRAAEPDPGYLTVEPACADIDLPVRFMHERFRDNKAVIKGSGRYS